MDRTVVAKLRYDLLRLQSVLANSSPDKCPCFDQRDCLFLGGAVRIDIGGLVGSSRRWRTAHRSVYAGRRRAPGTA